MVILALDVGTETGWAIARDGRILESGVQDFSKRRGESNGVMFMRFNKWLNEMLILMRNADLLIYEQAHMRGGAATEICVGLQTHAQRIASERDIESVGIHSGTLKKWACGSGKADKSQMIGEALFRTGRRMVDDNEADAVLMALWAAEEYETKSPPERAGG